MNEQTTKNAPWVNRGGRKEGAEGARKTYNADVYENKIAEAIKNARDTASQFATNSGSEVGNVTRGNQGVFDISDKEPGSPEYKKIRVDSTLRFLLK